VLAPLVPAAIGPEDEALRAEVRAFLAERLAGVPGALRARTWMGFDADFSRDLAARGWVGLTLPVEFGGGGRSPFARFVLIEELLAAGAPVAAPNSGSDLASVRTRAERTATGWRLNGSKIWTTYGHKAHYMVALVRTSGGPDDRQAGLSQLLIDLKTPGVTARPIRDLAGDEHFSEVFFEDVDLPEDALIGQEGQGWSQVNAELAFERSGPERLYSSTVLIDEWMDFIRSRGGPTGSETELAGRMLAQLATLRNMSLAVTGQLARGESPVVEASMVKDLGASFEQSIPALITDHLASVEGPVPAPLLATLDYLAGMSPTFSLRGGTREILRGIIARGLGLR